MNNLIQRLFPSCNILDIFMPYRNDDKRILEALKKVVDFNYYKGVELGIILDKYIRRYARDIIQDNKLNLSVYTTPYLNEKGMKLSNLDEEERYKAISYSIELVKYAADAGCKNFLIPSGGDPGDKDRKEAKKKFGDSITVIAEKCTEFNINVTIEPVDRYAYKKQLIGPMLETINWFEPIKKQNPNIFIHWDSAHEALGKTDLLLSLEYAKPYIAQIHLADAILDINHPCFGDLHMDVAEGPDFISEGFLTPKIGAEIIKKVSLSKKPLGVANTYISVEVLGHMGDDLWHKEKISRLYLQECLRIANEDLAI